MLVTELGSSILVRLVQYWNAFSPIRITELGIIVFLQPKTNELVADSIIALQSSRES